MSILPLRMRLCRAGAMLLSSLTSAMCLGGSREQPSENAYLVRDGQPRAEIIIAADAPRMVKLAASELQSYIEKLSGARLPIAHAESEPGRTRIYIGRSQYTAALQIDDAGLERGAFRITTGRDWIVLLGHDEDFVPQEPWARSGNPVERARVTAEWDALTGESWGNPIGDSLYRHYSPKLGLWDYDEGGSLNAVYELLRHLGVEWYMPGELGEILPEKSPTMELPALNLIKHPVFAIRHYMMAPFHNAHRDDLLWYLRLGLTRNDRELYPHGMRELVGRPEVKAAHPEFYALYGGRRDTGSGLVGHCFSSEALFEHHVRFVRFLFDYYPDERVVVSVMPEDGLGAVCQCDQCQGKGDAGRGSQAHMSDYVWGYVNRVALELYASHPHRKVSCFAYAGYLEPPKNIDQVSPNLVVSFDQPRHAFGDPLVRDQYLNARQQWLSKLSPGEKLCLGIHLPYTEPGRPHHGMPIYIPHAIAEDLRSLAGVSKGEFVSQGFERSDPRRIGGLHAPGFSHLNVFVSSRFYWDVEQEVDKLLDVYCSRFYGPAGVDMREFIEFCETHHPRMRKEREPIERAFELLTRAAEQVPPDSVYGRRIALVDEFIRPLRGLGEQLARGRENVPEVRGYLMPTEYIPDATIHMDGRLTEEAWERSGAYQLRELVTAEKPRFTSSFKVLWTEGACYIGIGCNDDDTENLNDAATGHDDPAIWRGDCVELLLETQDHSYYQIAVSPNGTIVDLDRISGLNTQWESDVEVATQVGDGQWTVEIRIPVANERHGDPLHQVVGRRPTMTYPWYINVCRARLRGETAEFSALSPTGTESFHDLSKFGMLYVK